MYELCHSGLIRDSIHDRLYISCCRMRTDDKTDRLATNRIAQATTTQSGQPRKKVSVIAQVYLYHKTLYFAPVPAFTFANIISMLYMYEKFRSSFYFFVLYLLFRYLLLLPFYFSSFLFIQFRLFVFFFFYFHFENLKNAKFTFLTYKIRKIWEKLNYIFILHWVSSLRVLKFKFSHI